MSQLVNTNQGYSKLTSIVELLSEEGFLTPLEADGIFSYAHKNMAWINKNLDEVESWLESNTAGAGSLFASLSFVVFCATVKHLM